ncbi:MAG: 50S ribosomal protein L6 [Candidatus Marinimicrobia bacterium]|nr:50S ribosomal protein L6 [Candidatus Neomarinimicrobiota bacterium]|tara:strand:+ start:1082 stop:1630 length:549 start_codon:yes stop_codon:yes gene_type:complete
MSRIGIKPINIPESVNVEVKDSLIQVTGKLGSLKFNFDKRVNVKLDSNTVTVLREKNNKVDRELHGLTRALVNNMVLGVSKGFKKELKLNGVGYTAEQKMGKFLQLNLGFSHPIIVEIPNDLKVETTNPTTIVVSGINKQYVGQFAAKVRSFRKPDPYKGKGIKYSDEVIRRKAGKAIGVGG